MVKAESGGDKDKGKSEDFRSKEEVDSGEVGSNDHN